MLLHLTLIDLERSKQCDLHFNGSYLGNEGSLDETNCYSYTCTTYEAVTKFSNGYVESAALYS